MAAAATRITQLMVAKPCISASHQSSRSSIACFGNETKGASWTKLRSSSFLSATQNFYKNCHSNASKSERHAVKAMAAGGKRAFIAGIADDMVSTPTSVSASSLLVKLLFITNEHQQFKALNIFETIYDVERLTSHAYKTNKRYAGSSNWKRYAGSSNWTVKEVAESVKQDFGCIDILVHSLANGPEVTKPLLETSRNGYLAAISASSYSFVSLLKHFLPIMNPGGATISLTYIASERIIPGYGGGMSSAKAALESDTQVLAFEAGRKHGVRVNTISAGPLGSRAAKAIGFIDMMINYSLENAPLQKELTADEVGNTAAFLSSPLASAITGAVVYVDNGLNAMGVGVDSPVFRDLDIPRAQRIEERALFSRATLKRLDF
ncbi:hypothetical protein SASPL_143441 [Salvia splendens]|uniref:Enoyl-[acyl-carrier protein] reductase I n=1 Tax=Salvia splendens TaxID=180675 RepID=A0A8X8WKW9_SALSN|nr:hypothetical protein SASPL_143441 [Salvia splendens]